jgi:hypothetical protein
MKSLKRGSTFTIYLYAYYVPESRGCKKISIPYQETINLGMLSKGFYTIQLKELLSGNVMNIIEDEDSRTIELVGTNPTNCLVFEKLETDVRVMGGRSLNYLFKNKI